MTLEGERAAFAPDPGDGPRVRAMRAGDLGAVRELSRELGYAVTGEELVERLASVSGDADHAAIVATDQHDRVVGWIHVHGSRTLLSPPRAEIAGLIVASDRRGRGLGRALVSAAEAWALDRGYGQIRVRSNTVRSDAHRFYGALGYRTTKTSHVFERSLT